MPERYGSDEQGIVCAIELGAAPTRRARLPPAGGSEAMRGGLLYTVIAVLVIIVLVILILRMT